MNYDVFIIIMTRPGDTSQIKFVSMTIWYSLA